MFSSTNFLFLIDSDNQSGEIIFIFVNLLALSYFLPLHLVVIRCVDLSVKFN